MQILLVYVCTAFIVNQFHLLHYTALTFYHNVKRVTFNLVSTVVLTNYH